MVQEDAQIVPGNSAGMAVHLEHKKKNIYVNAAVSHWNMWMNINAGIAIDARNICRVYEISDLEGFMI